MTNQKKHVYPTYNQAEAAIKRRNERQAMLGRRPVKLVVYPNPNGAGYLICGHERQHIPKGRRPKEYKRITGSWDARIEQLRRRQPSSRALLGEWG